MWKTGTRILCFTPLSLSPKTSFFGNVTQANNPNTEVMEISTKQTLKCGESRNWTNDLPCSFLWGCMSRAAISIKYSVFVPCQPVWSYSWWKSHTILGHCFKSEKVAVLSCHSMLRRKALVSGPSRYDLRAPSEGHLLLTTERALHGSFFLSKSLGGVVEDNPIPKSGVVLGNSASWSSLLCLSLTCSTHM